MANWIWIYSDDKYTIYVDNSSIQRDYNYSGYVFRAFLKWVYSDEGRKKVIEQRRSSGMLLPKEIYNLSNSIELCYYKELNGIKYESVLHCTYYTYNGDTIPEMSFSFDSPRWHIIPPDTIGEWVFNMIRARIPN